VNLTFEWDEEKSQDNLQKHSVSFEEAKTVFGDLLSITIADRHHSTDEHRFIDIGMSNQQRLLIVVYSKRKSNIRIISCREATTLERKVYEDYGI